MHAIADTSAFCLFYTKFRTSKGVFSKKLLQQNSIKAFFTEKVHPINRSCISVELHRDHLNMTMLDHTSNDTNIFITRVKSS